MENADPTQSQDFGKTPTGTSRETFMAAIGFWERGRLIYNLVLTGVVLFWLVATWPHFRAAMTLHSLLLLSILGLLANVCYCAAYIAEILLRSFSRTGERGRWEVWALGTLFAFLVANYWIADEIYPFVN